MNLALFYLLPFLLAFGSNPVYEYNPGYYGFYDESEDNSLAGVYKKGELGSPRQEYIFEMTAYSPNAYDKESLFDSPNGGAVMNVYDGNIAAAPVHTIEITSIYPRCWGYFYIVDLNFDGYNDILVITNMTGNQGLPWYSSFLWDQDQEGFVPAHFLPEHGSLNIDNTRKMYLSAWCIWAGGHGYALYEYQDGAVVQIAQCETNWQPDETVQLTMRQSEDWWKKNITGEEMDQLLLYDDLWQLGSDHWVNLSRQCQEGWLMPFELYPVAPEIKNTFRQFTEYSNLP